MTVHTTTLSKTDALDALYRATKPPQDQLLKTASAVAAAYRKAVDQSGFIEALNGRPIHVSFANFPTLEVSGFNKIYGKGMAQKALHSYAMNKSQEAKETPPSSREMLARMPKKMTGHPETFGLPSIKTNPGSALPYLR